VTAISFVVNEVPVEADVPARMLLVDFLRERLGLTGTKIGCAMGACGACTVHVDDMPVRACLLLTVQMEGRRVRTIEGLSTDGELHPLQAALRDCHGLQCGYCTPGLVMTLAPIADAGVALSEDAARKAISGNLCRCTGYDPIVRALVQATQR
jgi:aerobic carbon-monoxide dehydrogenase small subunit